MSLFDRLVDEALRTRADHAVLRPVVEKELLHHDILRELGGAGMLAGLVFVGGTCLRACHGSPRLSEDLDFTGGSGFRHEQLAELGRVLVERLATRYELPVRVDEPKQSVTRVATWKLVIETRPARRDLPAQRIHLDICAVPSHDPRPMVLRNPYGVDLGTSGLILRAQSREEILADKMIALALREGRVKNRDLWDIGWLTQHGIELPAWLIPRKVADHGRKAGEFVRQLRERMAQLSVVAASRRAYLEEMRRFLPAAVVRDTIELPEHWEWLAGVVAEHARIAFKAMA